MGRSRQPSKVVMPRESRGCSTVLEFLIHHFPKIGASTWRTRVADGKVHWQDGSLITADTPYAPQQKVYYYREAEREPEIPFTEEIVYQDDQILVACKPHFIPVSPVGKYVDQTLVSRLMARTGIQALAPVHRIDRETAGLVMLSVNPESRNLYHRLFRTPGLIRKTYLALAHIQADNHPGPGQTWMVDNRLGRGEPWLRMAVVPGEVNARSRIKCLDVYNHRALFQLQPLTGKTHQLRVHMSGLGYPLVNDRFYPTLQPEGPDNYGCPLQLLAYKLEFTDPVTGQQRCITTSRRLLQGVDSQTISYLEVADNQGLGRQLFGENI